MVEPRDERTALAAECAAWSRYLADVEPSLAVTLRYVAAHERGVVEPPGSECAFDRALVRLARRGSFPARLCDVHARIFRPAGLLRRKLVLALALLEVDEHSQRRIDQVEPGSRIGLVLRIGAWSLRFALLAALGVLVLVPVRGFCALGGTRGGEA